MLKKLLCRLSRTLKWLVMDQVEKDLWRARELIKVLQENTTIREELLHAGGRTDCVGVVKGYSISISSLNSVELCLRVDFEDTPRRVTVYKTVMVPIGPTTKLTEGEKGYRYHLEIGDCCRSYAVDRIA